MDGFIAGFAYGVTSVLVGQPLDTVKTRVQMLPSTAATRPSSWSVGRQIFMQEGVRGLYRGGMSLMLGGACIRSAQFGVNSLVLAELHKRMGGATRPEDRYFKVIDPQVVLAGFCGGVARGVVEGPFEYVKVRRQVDAPWKFRELWKGSGATVLRNSFLFGSFVLYMDISRIYVELSPFWLGSICANLAWLTIWPLDVVKTHIQADTTGKRSFVESIIQIGKTGALFRGLAPGLARSFIANGQCLSSDLCAAAVANPPTPQHHKGIAMMAYKHVEKALKD